MDISTTAEVSACAFLGASTYMLTKLMVELPNGTGRAARNEVPKETCPDNTVKSFSMTTGIAVIRSTLALNDSAGKVIEQLCIAIASDGTCSWNSTEAVVRFRPEVALPANNSF